MANAMPLDKGRILIVDDDDQSVRLQTHILKNKGFGEIRGTTDPRRTVALCKEFAPDLILLDLNMPHMNGFQVLESLRTEINDPTLPVVVLSGQDEIEERRKALALGAKDFLTKPFDLAELVTRIQNMMEMRVLHRQVSEQRNQLEHHVNPSTRRIVREGSGVNGRLTRRTVLFSDLRGFTSYSEKYSPVLVFEILDNALETQTKVVEKHQGEVDKFIGDCVMAVFRDASDSASAACEMLTESRKLLVNCGASELLPGIGIHTGEVMEGVIGKNYLRSYTVIGDTVNVAARLCSVAPSGSIVMSQATYNELDHDMRKAFDSDHSVQVRGRGESISVRSRRIDDAG